MSSLRNKLNLSISLLTAGWLMSGSAFGQGTFYQGQSQPRANPANTQTIIRGQSPGPYGGTAAGTVSPWEGGPAAYPAPQPVAPAAGSSNFQAPAAPAAALPGPAPTAGFQPTYPPNNPMQNPSPWQTSQPSTLPPSGIRTAFAGPAPAPGLFDPNQRLTPGDSLNLEGRPQPLELYPALDLEGYTHETETGKLMFGVGINSDAGLLGNIVLDEQNFDWQRWPGSFEEVRNGTAWRGAGQRFRLEAQPGTNVQRYVVSFTEPYLADTPVSLRLSGSYFTRSYTDWFEQRAGGRVGLGYLFTPDLSGAVNFRGEKIDISNPSNPSLPDLQQVLGQNDLFGFGVTVTHDTRDSAFLPTEGHYIEVGGEYVIGTFQYPRATIDARQYFTLSERADGSGRQVLSVSGKFGYTGDTTPIYDRFFAGGFSTIRGFSYRGASPRDSGVIVGGDFEFLGSVEYLFPITADDMLRGVVFCDFGTVEKSVKFDADSFRVTLGTGLRIVIPAMGQAPIALDLAVPVHWMHGDQINNFNFFVGFSR